MLNTVYQLKAPRQFELAFSDIQLDKEHIIVRPRYLSICNADQRYYQGLRPEKIMREKLPMALIHEGIGEVIYSPFDEYKAGDIVVMIPDIPSEKDEIVAENYLRSSKFRGSSTDGFLQEYIETVPDRIIRLPAGIDLKVAAFTELVSVSYHAIKRFDSIAHARRDRVGVWGDGNLGYITSLLLKTMYPEIQVIVFGVNDNKLADFTFANRAIRIDRIEDDMYVDHGFECVGGPKAPTAINQMIDVIKPEGTISLLGVTEEPAPINTRMVLEKGLRLFGSSRSGREDFEGLMELYSENPGLSYYLENIVGTVIEVRDLRDIVKAFETDMHKLIGKTVMVWNE